MKSIILLAIQMLYILVNVQGQNLGRFILNGHIDGRDTGMITLNYTSATEAWITDTSFLKNGNFKFEGTITEPTKAFLTGKQKLIDFNSGNTVSIFLEPGNLYVEVTEDNYKHANVTGSKTQYENDQFNFALDSINRKYKSYLDQHLQLNLSMCRQRPTVKKRQH